MSVYAKVWAYDQHPLQVDKDGNEKPETRNPAAKAVLVALAEHPGVGQRECWPSQETLSTMTDFDVRTVRKHLDVLQKQGYIARKERHRDGKRTTDMVTLLGPIEAFGPSQNATKKQPERGAGRKQSNRNVCPEQPERVSGEPVVEPSVKKDVSNDTFKESELSSTHKPKTLKVSDERAEELWESLIAEDENADILQEFAEFTASKLKTRSRSLATLWRQIGKPYLKAKESYGGPAVAAGLSEAMRRDIDNFRYAAGVASNWAPNNVHHLRQRGALRGANAMSGHRAAKAVGADEVDFNDF